MILIIDNYDSFTFNLVQQLGAIGLADESLRHEIEVVRNDATTLDELDALRPSHLIVSPGPRAPADSGISRDAIRHYLGRIPILGVCLGHQCIADIFGARVRRADQIIHGLTTDIHHDGKGIFATMPNPFAAMRYHSLIVEGDSLPAALEVSAWTMAGECMAIRHRELALEGVQFHPESFATDGGARLMENFLRSPTASAKNADAHSSMNHSS